MARSNVVICIGGTGARVMEAVVHLAASGFFTSEEHLYILFVDPDVDNGNLLRSTNIIKQYRYINENLGKMNENGNNNKIRDRVIFSTRLSYIGATTIDEIALYNPVGVAHGKNLEDYFQISTFQRSHSLARTLYADNEIKEPLDKGFKGRPSIGAPFMLYKLKRDMESHSSEGKNWWKDLIRSLDGIIGSSRNENEKPRIVLIGSVFGGTGASGLPTISKILRDRYKNSIKIGGIFMLPYFAFEENKVEGTFISHSAIFDYKSVRALKYYASMRYDYVYDHIYLVGSERKFLFEKFKVGGKEQENPITIVDLVAATAVKHFLVRDFILDKSPKLSYFNASSIEKDGKSYITISSLAVNIPKYIGLEQGEKSAPIRVVTYINLFIILSLFLLAWFPEGAKSKGFSVFNLKHSEDKATLLTKYLPFIESFLRFVNDVLNTTDINRTLFADILIDSLRPAVDNAVKLISLPLNNRANSKEYKDFVKEYNKVLGFLNTYVVNEVATIGAKEGFNSDDEFVLTLYGSIVKHVKRFIQKIGKADREWLEIMDEKTLDFIISILFNVLKNMFAGLPIGGVR